MLWTKHAAIIRRSEPLLQRKPKPQILMDDIQNRFFASGIFEKSDRDFQKFRGGIFKNSGVLVCLQNHGNIPVEYFRRPDIGALLSVYLVIFPQIEVSGEKIFI